MVLFGLMFYLAHMMEQEPKQVFNETVEHLNEYIETQKEIIKLQAVKHTSGATGNTAAILLFALFLSITYLFANVAAALLCATYLGSLAKAFALIGGINCLIGFILWFFKEQLVVKPIQNIIIKHFTE